MFEHGGSRYFAISHLYCLRREESFAHFGSSNYSRCGGRQRERKEMQCYGETKYVAMNQRCAASRVITKHCRLGGVSRSLL